MLRLRFLFDVAFPALVMCLTGILLYSAVVSDTGYRALSSLQKEAAEKEVDVSRELAETMEGLEANLVATMDAAEEVAEPAEAVQAS